MEALFKLIKEKGEAAYIDFLPENIENEPTVSIAPVSAKCCCGCAGGRPEGIGGMK